MGQQNNQNQQQDINQLLKVNDVDVLRSISSIINKNDGKTDNNTTVDKNIIEYISWEIEDSTMSIIDLVEKAEHLNNEFFNKYHLGTVPEDSVDKEKAVMFYYMKDQMSIEVRMISDYLNKARMTANKFDMYRKKLLSLCEGNLPA